MYRETDEEMAVALVQRDGKFVEPEGGWCKEGRTYQVTLRENVLFQASGGSTPTQSRGESQAASKHHLQYFRIIYCKFTESL